MVVEIEHSFCIRPIAGFDFDPVSNLNIKRWHNWHYCGIKHWQCGCGLEWQVLLVTLHSLLLNHTVTSPDHTSHEEKVWLTESNFLGLLPERGKNQWDCNIVNYYVAHFNRRLWCAKAQDCFPVLAFDLTRERYVVATTSEMTSFARLYLLWVRVYRENACFQDNIHATLIQGSGFYQRILFSKKIPSPPVQHDCRNTHDGMTWVRYT